MEKLRSNFFVLGLALAMGSFVIIAKPVAAQTPAKTAEPLKKYHLKLSRTVNGKTTELDTTIVGPENASVRKLLTGQDIPADRLRTVDFNVLPDKRLSDSIIKKLEERRIIWLPLREAGKLDTLHRIIRVRELSGLVDSGRVQLNRIIRILPPNIAFDSLVKTDVLRFNVDSLPGRTIIIREFTADSTNLLPHDYIVHRVRPGAKNVIINKSEWKELTAADKDMLKKAVAPAELESKKELKLNDLKYYPNPNNGKFKLSFSAGKGEQTAVEIYDQEGKEVYSEAFPQFSGSFTREIDISKFGQGIFFLRVVQGNRTLTKKLLIQ
jgi:hypothetical protein